MSAPSADPLSVSQGIPFSRSKLGVCRGHISPRLHSLSQSQKRYRSLGLPGDWKKSPAARKGTVPFPSSSLRPYRSNLQSYLTSLEEVRHLPCLSAPHCNMRRLFKVGSRSCKSAKSTQTLARYAAWA